MLTLIGKKIWQVLVRLGLILLGICSIMVELIRVLRTLCIRASQGISQR
jgi:hypothetical protein